MPGANVQTDVLRFENGERDPSRSLQPASRRLSPGRTPGRDDAKTDTKVIQNCYTKGGWVFNSHPCHPRNPWCPPAPATLQLTRMRLLRLRLAPIQSILRTNPRTFLRPVSFSTSYPRTHAAMDYLTPKSNKTERSTSVQPPSTSGASTCESALAGRSIQRFNDSTVQRFNDSTIQRFNGSTVQRFNASTIREIA